MIKRVSLTFNNTVSDECFQCNMFADSNEVREEKNMMIAVADIKEKYGKKENQQKNTLPNPRQQNKTPKSLDDLLKKFNSMTPEEYAEARKKNFK